MLCLTALAGIHITPAIPMIFWSVAILAAFLESNAGDNKEKKNLND